MPNVADNRIAPANIGRSEVLPGNYGSLEGWAAGERRHERKRAMSNDVLRNTSTLRSDRRTVTQLLAAAEKDTDAVSVFMAGCTVADTDAAVFVVKGPEAIAYLREL